MSDLKPGDRVFFRPGRGNDTYVAFVERTTTTQVAIKIKYATGESRPARFMKASGRMVGEYDTYFESSIQPYEAKIALRLAEEKIRTRLINELQEITRRGDLSIDALRAAIAIFNQPPKDTTNAETTKD